MSNSFVADLMSSIAAGVLVVVIDRLVLPKEMALTVGPWGLLFVATLAGAVLSAVFSAVKSVMQGRSGWFSLQAATFFSIASLAFFAYRIYPDYYYRVIASDVIDKMEHLKTSKKPAALRLINEDFTNVINPLSPSSAHSSVFMREIVKKRPILSTLASLHPNVFASPMLLKGIVFSRLGNNCSTNEIELSLDSWEETSVVGSLKYFLGKPIVRPFISVFEAQEILQEMNKGLRITGTVCRTVDDYLLISTSKTCPPVTNKVLLGFLAKPHMELWIVLAEDQLKYLLSPQVSLHKRDFFSEMFDISVRQVGAQVSANKDTYVIELARKDSAIAISVFTSFQVAGERNWLIVDNEEILKPKALNLSSDGDGPWEMRFERLSATNVQRLLEAKSLTLQYLRTGQSEEEEHQFPMGTFAIAYQAFSQGR